MDIKVYISSGILEAYVLGALSAEEAERVQQDIALHSELAAEVKQIESAMMNFAREQAIEPPGHLQDQVWNAISGKEIEAEQHTPKIIPLQPEYRSRIKWQYAALAACLAGSIVVNVTLWNENRGQSARLSAVLHGAKVESEQMSAQLAAYQKTTAMMADTTMQTVVMQSKVPGHPMAATVYWSRQKGDTYVAMQALPEPPKGMQYQAWVIQNGQPVSMGTLPNNMAGTPGMQKLTGQVTSGEAFAISLEKEGGSATPTTVYVLGKA